VLTRRRRAPVSAAGPAAGARTRLIVVGPVPPPTHGVTISTALVLANPLLSERFDVEHLDTSDRRAGLSNIGTWDLTNVVVALRSALRLGRRLRSGPGVVYLPLSSGVSGFLRDAVFIWLASVRGWKVTAHLRGGEFDEFVAAQPRPLRWWIKRVLRRVDSMAVMGRSLAHMFDGLIAADRIAVVPNGTPEIERDGHVRDPDAVLFLSNLLARKGIVEAVAAAELVVARHPTARFRFIGSWYDDELARALQQRTRALRDRIEFVPSVGPDGKREALLSASILLFCPVLSEGHPRVVLEGLAAGLPVVTTDRGAIAETVVDGESGFVLADPVPEQLAERILLLLEDAGLRDRMSAAARARYETAFSQERADRRLADWLEGVAGHGG
jgi:glycosyltransferase involved in cell wall biosynthesis